MFSCWALSPFAWWDESPYALGSWLPGGPYMVWLSLEHGLELLSYGNDTVGCGWCISDMVHVLICMAEVWVHVDPETQNHPCAHIAFISVHNSQIRAISINRVTITFFFAPIGFSIINTLLTRHWLWMRKCPCVIVMKVWGVYSDWVHTEASFMPYHRFPPKPFFDWLLVHFLLPLLFPWGKPLNKTFPRLSFASRAQLKIRSGIVQTATGSPYTTHQHIWS